MNSEAAPDPILRAVVGITCALFFLAFILSFLVKEPRESGLLPKTRPYMTALDWILRGLLAINVALVVVTLMPESSGIRQLADRLWGNYRLDGWSADVVWVCASTPFVVIASIPFIVVGGVIEIKERYFHKTAIFCVAWLACLPFYMGYMLLHAF
jgi:hypothetical protein